MQAPTKCYVRFLHAIPDASGLDVYINGYLVENNLKYRGFTEYYGGNSGIYNVQLYPAGSKTTPLIDQHLDLHNKTIYTLAIEGVLADPSLCLVTDTKKNIDKSQAYMRFINLCPSLTDFDIILDNREIINELSYNEISHYLTISPGTHYLKILDGLTKQALVEHPSLSLQAGKEYACYIVGIKNGRPEPQILIPLEGSTYLTL